MMATIATPHIESLDGLIAADLEIARLLGRLRGLARRLAGSAARHALGSAYVHRIEDKYEEVAGQLRVARMRAQALCRLD
jgi:hypothetical protein